MLRCYDSKRQNQEGWSSLHAHFRGKRHRFTTLNHKQKNLQRCRAYDCAQKIFASNKTAEGRLVMNQDNQTTFRREVLLRVLALPLREWRQWARCEGRGPAITEQSKQRRT